MVPSFAIILLLSFGYISGELPLIPDPDITKFRQIDSDQSYRLPYDTIPLSYNITLEPIFDNFTFNGAVSIVIRAVQDTNVITMHAVELNTFTDIFIYGIGDNVITVPPEKLQINDTDYQFLKIPIGVTVPADTEFTLSMKYTGVLNENNTGFYRAAYKEDEQTKWFAMTQFAPTDARKAFPCYDEPGIKTPFKINIIRHETYHSISNMEQDGDPIKYGNQGKYIDVYKESVPMPTYLVAFIVSQLGHTLRKNNQIAYAAEHLIKEGRAEYALQIGIATLRAIEEFTDYNYTLNKMFQVAIPDYYLPFTAMENWGLVTFREEYLLYKKGTTTASEQQTIASIIAHEYGHQWFGNLVSPAWWKYVWLNEGFATYFEYRACDLANPEMRMLDQFVVLAVQRAMESDATENSREMSFDAQTPSEINSLYDRIAYDKSGSVIRMMEHVLTTDVYRRGLNIYLNKMQYGVAESSNLWMAMEAAINESGTDPFHGRSVKQVMHTWEYQPGFPIITAKRNNGKITIEQERYFINQPSTNYSTIWNVPINFASASNPDFTDTTPQYWLTEASQEFDIAVADEDWFILNKQETGYYRVNYDEENWNLIIDYLRSTYYSKVHVLNRAQLVDDALNLARSGRLCYNITMNLLLYLKRETDYIPLYSFFQGLAYLDKFVASTEQYTEFKNYIKEVLQGTSNALGTDNSLDSHTDKLNRINVLTWLCRIDHEDCVKQMNNRFSDLLSNRTPVVNPDLQTLIYCSGQKHIDHKDAKLEYLFRRYLGVEAEDLEKSRILSAIGCSNSESVLKRVLNIASGKDEVYGFNKTTEIATAFSSVYTESKIGLRVAFDYIIGNFGDMDENLTTDQVYYILIGIADRLTSQELIDKWNTFRDSLPEELKIKHKEAIGDATSVIQSNLAWSRKHLGEITDFLKVYSNE